MSAQLPTDPKGIVESAQESAPTSGIVVENPVVVEIADRAEEPAELYVHRAVRDYTSWPQGGAYWWRRVGRWRKGGLVVASRPGDDGIVYGPGWVGTHVVSIGFALLFAAGVAQILSAVSWNVVLIGAAAMVVLGRIGRRAA